jgi:hypothetical protein
MEYRLTNVEALWPRIDRPYKYDQASARFQPADKTDRDASYEMTLIVTEEQAKELAGKMREVFNTSEKTKGKQWIVEKKDPETGLKQQTVVKALEDLFEKDENCYRVKTSIKTYGDKFTKPRQFMQDGSPAAEDFQLTTGSIVHTMLRIDAWQYGDKVGIGLRPRGVMVVRLEDRKEPENSGSGSMFGDLVQNDSPFADMTPGAAPSAPPAAPKPAEAVNPFGLPDVPADKQEKASNDFDDEIPF